jgi:SAM-dependent methyltransferase
MTEAIHYDPLKAVLGRCVSRSVLGRRLFYTALGMLFLRQWHVRAVLKRIARTKKVSGIFDAGSGYGQYSYIMGKFFPDAKITAVDVKDEQIDDGRWFAERVGQKNVTFEVGDLTTFVKANAFDLALSVDVMEHILEDEAVYRNVSASMKSGGLFVITTPAIDHVPPPSGAFESVIGEHVREGYTEQEFRAKLTRAGFVVERMRRSYGPVWGRIAWQLLQRIPMKLLTISKWFAIVVVPWMIVVYLPAALCMWLDVMLPNRTGGGWVVTARKP